MKTFQKVEIHIELYKLLSGTLMDCYDELGNRYQLPIYVLSSPSNLIEDKSEPTDTDENVPASPGIEVPMKFRLSTGKDTKLLVRTSDSVLAVKKQIFSEQGVDVSVQKWCYSGRVLTDKMRIEDIKIPKGHVIQVVVLPSMKSSDSS